MIFASWLNPVFNYENAVRPYNFMNLQKILQMFSPRSHNIFLQLRLPPDFYLRI